VSGNDEGDLRPERHRADVSLRHRHDEAKAIGVDDLQNGLRARLAGGRSDEGAWMQLATTDDAAERRGDLEIGLRLGHGTKRVTGGLHLALRRGHTAPT